MLLTLLWGFAATAGAGYPVSVISIVHSRWQSHIQVLAEVRSLSHAVLRAEVGGRLSPFGVPDGSYVRAGDVLGRIIPPGLETRIAAAHSRLQLARQLHQHERRLVQEHLATQSVQEQAATQVAVDADSLRGLERERDQNRLIAPSSGTVHYLIASGTQVSAGAAVIRLGGTGKVWLRAFVTPSVARRLHVGQRASLLGSGPHPDAQLTAIGHTARHDGLVEIFLNPGDRGLLPGEWRWAILSTETGFAWRIPRPALVMQGAQAHIYMLHQGRAQKRSVRVVHVSQQYVWVLGRLHVGEQVIVRGASKVSNATPVSPHPMPVMPGE